MDIDYEEVIDFSIILKTLKERGIMQKFVAEKIGIMPTVFSRICRNDVFPKTDLLAKIAAVLKVPLSEVVVFKLSADELLLRYYREGQNCKRPVRYD